jgi:hypothetical protein
LRAAFSERERAARAAEAQREQAARAAEAQRAAEKAAVPSARFGHALLLFDEVIPLRAERRGPAVSDPGWDAAEFALRSVAKALPAADVLAGYATLDGPARDCEDLEAKLRNLQERVAQTASLGDERDQTASLAKERNECRKQLLRCLRSNSGAPSRRLGARGEAAR